MITRKGEASRLLQTGQTYTFIARMREDEKALLRVAQEKLRHQLGDSPSNPVLLSALLNAYVAGTPEPHAVTT